MPRLNKPHPAAVEIAARLALVDQFERGFRRSDKGNLTRMWDEDRVTVFKYRGGYSWVIGYSDESKEFSKEIYVTEEEAMSALSFQLFS